MKIRMNALDTLTFGVGKPSVRGEDSFGIGIFPPYPSVVRGAMRASWLFEHGTVEIANEDEDLSKEYIVSEYALLLGNIPYFTAPADFVWNENEQNLNACKRKENDGLSSLTTPYQLYIDVADKMMPADKRYISQAMLQQYLEMGTIDTSVSLSDYITTESKIGITRRTDTHTVKQSMLYSSPLIRLHNAALVANIEGAQISGLIRFGGKNKVAHVSEYEEPISPNSVISDDGIFKLYLATPAFFHSGHLPDLPDPIKNKVSLLTAAVYGYESIGGFDIKANFPKPMRRAVKAGSVYYYKLNHNTDENRAAVLALHGSSISSYSSEDGFGICYIGKIGGQI
jgi:CRISPR-associated protein Cmr3